MHDADVLAYTQGRVRTVRLFSIGIDYPTLAG